MSDGGQHAAFVLFGGFLEDPARRGGDCRRCASRDGCASRYVEGFEALRAGSGWTAMKATPLGESIHL